MRVCDTYNRLVRELLRRDVEKASAQLSGTSEGLHMSARSTCDASVAGACAELTHQEARFIGLLALAFPNGLEVIDILAVRTADFLLDKFALGIFLGVVTEYVASFSLVG
jgi:hypothetical protein